MAGESKQIYQLTTKEFDGNVLVPFDAPNTDPSTQAQKPYVSGKASGDAVADFIANTEEYATDLDTEAKTITGAINELHAINGYNYDAYDDTATYAVGDLCIYNNTLYKCTTAITTAEAWNASHWTATSIADEIGAITEYSTTEKAVGEWIDGSTIYQKTLYIASMPDGSSSETDYEFGNFKFDMVVDYSAILFTSSKDQFIPMPYIYTGSALADIQFGFAVRNDKSYVGIRSEGVDRSTQSGYITVKYTKAT